MPRKVYRRRRFKKSPWYKRKYNAMQLASKAWKSVRYIKGLVNSEMLHIQNTQTGIGISTTGGVAHLTNIAQGDTDSGRTGNSILVRSLLFRISIVQHVSATTTFCRFILLQDKQQVSDTSPALADVLQSVNYISPLNDSNIGRFKILMNIVISLDSASKKCYVKDIYKKLYSHVRYNGSASSDVQKNGIYLMLLSSEATNAPTFAYETKIGYHDN